MSPKNAPHVPLAAVVLLAAGCGSAPLEPDAPDSKVASEAPLTACRVPISTEVVALAASRDGVVLGVPAPTRDGELTLQRYRGAGCSLQPEGAPVAVGSLLAVDDLANIYAFPAEAHSADVVSTMLPGERPNSMVAKIDASGQVIKLFDAGRGIWEFGVSPQGGTLWMTACGPTGIFSMPDNAASVNMTGVSPVMTPPDTLWDQFPSVLASDRTFWSVGYRTCNPKEPMTPACGYALVRTTPEGSSEVGTTVVDFGQGYEAATLARCGADVCGVFASGVIVWDDQGRVVRSISPSDLGAEPSEQIERASGNHLGVYVLLRSQVGARVVFVPVRR